MSDQIVSKFVNTSTFKLHYNEFGAGHPVIMLHGSGPGATGWSNFGANVPYLHDKYRVLLVDFPGWGLSDPFLPAEESRFDANARCVLEFMDQLSIDNAALVGNSMGGVAAQMVTAMAPERVSHMVTMGAPSPGGPPHFYSPAGLTEGLKVVFACYSEPSLENFRRMVEIMVFDPKFATDELLQQRRDAAVAYDEHLRNFIATVASMHIDAVGSDSLVRKLSQSRVPSLIIHGRDDRVVGVEHSLRTAALVPNALLAVFNQCGHWAQVEKAAQFNALLNGFIQA